MKFTKKIMFNQLEQNFPCNQNLHNFDCTVSLWKISTLTTICTSQLATLFRQSIHLRLWLDLAIVERKKKRRGKSGWNYIEVIIIIIYKTYKSLLYTCAPQIISQIQDPYTEWIFHSKTFNSFPLLCIDLEVKIKRRGRDTLQFYRHLCQKKKKKALTEVSRLSANKKENCPYSATGKWFVPLKILP